MTTRLLTAVVLALALTACTTGSNGPAVPPSDAEIPELATIEDAFMQLGIPNRMAYDEDGRRTLIYEYEDQKGRAGAIGFPVWQLLAFAHNHTGFDRLEVLLDSEHNVTDTFVVIVSDGFERRISPFWDGDLEPAEDAGGESAGG